jgi:uncharacterized protein (DUF1778 family)
MGPATLDVPMTKRNDVSVKIDAEVMAQAKIAAAIEGKSVAEYLTEAAEEKNERVLSAFKASADPKRKPKGGK